MPDDDLFDLIVVNELSGDDNGGSSAGGGGENNAGCLAWMIIGIVIFALAKLFGG